MNKKRLAMISQWLDDIYTQALKNEKMLNNENGEDWHPENKLALYYKGALEALQWCNLEVIKKNGEHRLYK